MRKTGGRFIFVILIVCCLVFVHCGGKDSQAASKGNQKNITPILASLLLAQANMTNNIKVVIGDDGLIKAFKGKESHSYIKVFDGYKLEDNSNYTYQLLSGPSGMTINPEGVIISDIVKLSRKKQLYWTFICIYSNGKVVSSQCSVISNRITLCNY